MNSDKYPIMTIYLIVSSKEMELDTLNPILLERCSRKRRKIDFPEASKKQGFASNTVEFTMNELGYRSVDEAVLYFRDNCIGKALNQIIEAVGQGWEISVDMAIVVQEDDYPEVWLSEETISFLHQIHASFGISIYTDDKSNI